eukprot:313386-Prymnesium_polylepis.1
MLRGSASLDAAPAEAVEAFTAALSARAEVAAVAAQEPIPAEPIDWEGSMWQEHRYGSELQFDESVTAYEFGACANGEMLLTDCAVGGEEGEVLTGYFERPEGAGEFELVMAPDGRSFDGVLADDDGSEETWCGARCAEGAYGESPPSSVRWVLKCLLGRARAHLALGEPQKALDDAREATALCCRVAAAWRLRAEAAEACADDDEQAAAGREL